MILVLSGKYQGATDFAKSNFPGKSILTKNVDEYDFSIDDDIDEEASRLYGQILSENKDIVLCHITGCGVVPCDERQRFHAELVGRTSCLLAKEAFEVWLVTAGIGKRIK